MKFKRRELKSNAKGALKGKFWNAFLACLIFAVIFAAAEGPATVTATKQAKQMLESGGVPAIGESTPFATVEDTELLTEDNVPALTGNTADEAGAVENVKVTSRTSFMSLLMTLLVLNILTVGIASYFIKLRRGDANVGNLFDGFRSHYGTNVGTMLCVGIFTFLWSLLLVIPGIVKAYQYSMIPYILSDNPNITRKEAFKESKRLTKGYKGKLFVLDLSFIGWAILALIPAGLGLFFLEPYYQATKAEAYEKLKAIKGDVVNA